MYSNSTYDPLTEDTTINVGMFDTEDILSDINKEPNVGQFGYSATDFNEVSTLLDYINRALEAAINAENSAEEVLLVRDQIVAIQTSINEIYSIFSSNFELFENEYADFLVKNQDFLSKYALISQMIDDVNLKYEEIVELGNYIKQLGDDIKVLHDQVVEYSSQTSANAIIASNAAISAEASKVSANTSEVNAKNSEIASKLSETESKNSEINSKLSEVNSKTSEINSKLSETNASHSEASAGASATSATASEASASSSAISALQSKESAQASETASRISEINSKQSELESKQSELASKSSEDNAKSSETASKTSEVNSKQSEVNSALSAASSQASAIEAANSDASAINAAASALDSKNSAKASEISAAESAIIASNAASVASGALIEAGNVDLSSGVYPTPLKDSSNNPVSCYWKVTVGGIVNGIDYGSGDSLVYSKTISGYYKIDNTESVTSVAGKQGVVTLNKNDVGLSNVDNTSDINKPVSTATQSLLDLKVDKITTINGKNLSSSVTLNASDVGAAPSSHVGSGGASHATATTLADGFMSKADKSKLDSIAASANNYVHPTSGITAGTYKSVTVDGNGHVTGGSNPTLADLGAMSSSGGEMLGPLTLGINDLIFKGADTGDIVFANADGSQRGRVWHSGSGVTFSSTESTLPAAAGSMQLTSAGLTVAGNLVYHAGNKPTAVDVGALPLTGGTLTGPVSLKTIQGQGSSIGWASIDVTGTKGGYAGINFPDAGHWFGVRPDSLSGVWDSAGNSKWYFNELGQLTGGAKVPWGIVYDTPGRNDWVNKNSIGVVSGQLAWKNYGNGHTIFDASAGTSPDGTTVDKNNSQIAWRSNDANYPTLMGWNGANTYGVRVDSARAADLSTTADRLTGVVSTNGQDLKIHDKRAMVGAGDANQLIINYGGDWGSTAIVGPVYLNDVQSGRHVVFNNGSTSYSNSGLEVRSTDGSDARIGFHRSGHSAAAINHNSWGFQFEREAGGGSRANVAAANFFADAAQDTSANALTRLDYVNSLVNSRNVHTWKGQKGDANASFGLGSYIWHPTATNLPISNTYAHGMQFGGVDYANGAWVSDIAFIHGQGLYHRATVNGGFADWSKFAFAQEVNYTATPTQYRSNSSWIGLVSGMTGTDAVVMGTNSGAATIGGHSNGLDAWAPLYINCHPNSGTTAPLVLSAPKVKLPDNNTLYDVFHAGNFDPNSKLSNNGSGGTLYLSNWFRSTGNTGWYNETWAGGLYMDEASTIKVHNGKRIFTSNDENYAIGAEGGIFSNRRMWVDTRKIIGNGSSYNAWRYGDAPFHAGMGGLNVGSFAPIVGSSNYTNGHGYTTRVQFGVVTPGGSGWSNAVIMVGSAENDAQPLAAYNFGADGHMTGSNKISTGYLFTERSDASVNLELKNNTNNPGLSFHRPGQSWAELRHDGTRYYMGGDGQNFTIGNDMVCSYAYANGAQPQAANALTRKDYVDGQVSNARWGNTQVINHSSGDANAHYNSAWDGDRVANAPSASWYFFRELYHSNAGNWRHQEAFDFHSDEEWFRRGINTSEYSSWYRRWHSGNFNPDSKANLSGATFTGIVGASSFTAQYTVTGTTGVFDGSNRVFSDVYHPKFAYDKQGTATTLWTGSSSSHPTTITLSEVLSGFSKIRFEGVNAGAGIAWATTLSYDELAAICNTGLLVYIASGVYSYTFNPFNLGSTTLTRNTSVNGYLTKIVGIR